MPNRFSSPDQQFADQNGIPYAGGFLAFFASGTSTPLNTFSDFALTVANTNPVVLDSAGRAGSIFLQNLAYKVVLSDKNSNQIWTEDPVATSDFTAPSQFQVFSGNPNGSLAGSSNPASVVWDSADNVLYVCTTAGSASTAVWTAVNQTSAITTGDVKWKASTATEGGWVRGNALTIGSATSGATERANADTSALFSYFWNNFSNTQCPVSSGRGASAAVDFAANKTIGVLDMRGLSPVGIDTMGNSAGNNFTGVPFTVGNSSTAASVAGENTHLLAVTELPAHTHSGTTGNDSPDHTHSPGGVRFWTASASNGLGFTTSNPGGAIVDDQGPTLGASVRHQHPFTTDNGTGGAGVHNNVHKSMLGTWYFKL